MSYQHGQHPPHGMSSSGKGTQLIRRISKGQMGQKCQMALRVTRLPTVSRPKGPVRVGADTQCKCEAASGPVQAEET